MAIAHTVANIKRLRQILSVLARNGLDDIVATVKRKSGVTLPFGLGENVDAGLSQSERLKKSIEELGPTFIKLAQILSTRPDLIGPGLMAEFEKLQAEVTPIPFERIAPVFLQELGKPCDALFLEKPQLLASASIGQVYKARLMSGEEVAVKVRKPGIEEIIRSDLEILRLLAGLLERELYRYGIDSPKNVVEEFARAINKELNYVLEGMNLSRFAHAFAGDPRIIVPKFYEAYSSKMVLTMEYVRGIKASDKGRLKEAGIDPKVIAKKGFELLCEQVFKHRFYHADPHPGNIFVLEDSRISFVDFGMMGKITQKEQKEVAELIYFIAKNDEEKAALVLLNMSKMPEEIDQERFAKEMGDLFSTYFYGSLDKMEIKGIFDDATGMMAKYQVFFREEYYLLFKALITIEGVGRSLDPDLNVSKEIGPIINDFYKEQMSLQIVLARLERVSKDAVDLFSELPGKLQKLLNQMAEGKFKAEFEHVGLEAMEESIEKSANRLSIAIIIAAILVGSSLLLLAKTPPLFFGVPLFGLVGIAIGVVMSFLLIFSILRKGRL